MHALVDQPLSHDALIARWRELLADANLPDRFELDAFGEVVVSPSPSNRHELIVSALLHQLQAQLGGWAGMPSLARAGHGVFKPDLAWMADAEAFRRASLDDPFSAVPDLVVEVVSPGNDEKRPQFDRKVAGYLAIGVPEVVLVERDGRIRFLRVDGEHAQSRYDVSLELPPGTFPR